MLRRFRADDVDLLADIDTDPEVMRYLAPTLPSREEIETHILPQIIEQYAHGPIARKFAAHERASGDFVGWFSLDGDPRNPELGYRLRRDWWGRGFATEGARALIDLAFTEGVAQRVWAQMMFVNAGSRRVMKKM